MGFRSKTVDRTPARFCANLYPPSSAVDVFDVFGISHSACTENRVPDEIMVTWNRPLFGWVGGVITLRRPSTGREGHRRRRNCRTWTSMSTGCFRRNRRLRRRQSQVVVRRAGPAAPSVVDYKGDRLPWVSIIAVSLTFADAHTAIYTVV